MLSWQTFRLIYWHIKLLRRTPTTTRPPSPVLAHGKFIHAASSDGGDPLAAEKQLSADRLPSTKRFPSAGVGDPAPHETALGEWRGEKKKEGFTAVVQREAGIF